MEKQEAIPVWQTWLKGHQWGALSRARAPLPAHGEADMNSQWSCVYHKESFIIYTHGKHLNMDRERRRLVSTITPSIVKGKKKAWTYPHP